MRSTTELSGLDVLLGMGLAWIIDNAREERDEERTRRGWRFRKGIQRRHVSGFE